MRLNELVNFFSENRWICYNSAKGNDNYTYNLILDAKTGLLWVNGDKYEYSFVCKTKSNINLVQ